MYFKLHFKIHFQDEHKVFIFIHHESIHPFLYVYKALC